jgi:hypothetical protein
MPFVRGFLRLVKRKDRWGRPIDPDYGVDEGELPGIDEPDGEYPDQGLPPRFPHRPGNRPPGSWRPGERPGHGLPLPPKPDLPPWERPIWPPGPIDPDWGVDGPEGELPPGELPPEGIPPGDWTKPIPKPPPELPPGSIWPPLPPTAPPGTHWYLMYISGVGHRYGKFVVPDTPPPRPQPQPPGGPEVDPTRRR